MPELTITLCHRTCQTIIVVPELTITKKSKTADVTITQYDRRNRRFELVK